MKSDVIFRENLTKSDMDNVLEILTSTGFFYDFEIEVAVELVEEYLQKGNESGYHFLFAESGGRTIGYSCYGPIPCTKHSYDLYWIGVHNDFRGKGIGKKLLAESEIRMGKLGGKKIFIETSSTGKYLPTRKFYLDCGYEECALLKEFYGPGDHKHIYEKAL